MPIGTRDHIHLAETLGGSPEFAPIYKWKIKEREEVPVVFINVQYTLRARLRVHRGLDENGNVVQLTNFLYRVKLIETGNDSVLVLKDRLKGLLGKPLYLCDSYHNADGEDHTPSIKEVYMTAMGGLKNDFDATGLRFYFVEIQLTDASRS